VTDPYQWPGTSCLRNKIGIRDPAELAHVEARIVAVRDVQVARDPLPGEFNLQHLQGFHYFLFQDVYDWAGKCRTVDISRDEVPFCSWRFIDDEVSATLSHLAQDRWLIGLDRAEFIDRLAYHYGELNARHPFREGNGRTQRAFLRQLAAAAGWRLDWSALDKDANIKASRHNLRTANHSLLAQVLAPVVTRM
jgi:cell filamentation protein